MVALIKKVLPSSVKDKIKSINRERQLGVAVKRLTAAAENGAPTREVLAELERAWGEDGFRAVGGYLEEVARFATEARGPVLEIGSGLTTLILGALEDFLARTSRPFPGRCSLRRSRQQQRIAVDPARPAA